MKPKKQEHKRKIFHSVICHFASTDYYKNLETFIKKTKSSQNFMSKTN